MKAKTHGSFQAYNVDKEILEEGTQDQLKREWLLFKQLNRINEAQSVGSPLFINSVDCLEVNLWPEIVKDEGFKKKIKDVEKNAEESIQAIRQNDPRVDYSDEKEHILFAVARDKFKILMEIMDKKNLLPIKKANFYELDQEETGKI